MDLADFYALQTATAPLLGERDVKLSVVDLGVLRVPSGLLGASDPYVELDEGVVIPIPPGDYPVRVTIADVSEEQDGSHPREAYLSVVLSDSPTTTVAAASGVDGPPPEGQYFGVGVDAGTVAFVDSAAVAASMPADGGTWYDDVFDSESPDAWFTIMDNDAPLPAGLANIVMPLAADGENVVLSHSGWGDGWYPVLETRNSDGELTGIHIDLQVVGVVEEEPDEVPVDPPAPSGFFARLFGR
jgi:hypothetical protein